MEQNELKKELYKQNPKAEFTRAKKGNLHYRAVLTEGLVINFKIPFSDLGDAEFTEQMDSKLLIRWIV